jgi:hypothetical protein
MWDALGSRLGEASRMGAVEYEDDDRKRFVVRRYAFDPARNERRHVVVAVVDNNREFKKLIKLLSDELEGRRATGEAVDPREHITGHVMEPGHLARAANGHLLRRAIEHGVYPKELESIDLPGNMTVFRSAEQP